MVGTEKSSAWSGAIKEAAKVALGADMRGKPGVTGTFNQNKISFLLSKHSLWKI